MSIRLITRALLIGALLLPGAGHAATQPSGHPERWHSAPALPGDAALCARVKTQIAKDRVAGALEVKVDSDQLGVVTLSGRVNGLNQASRVATIARAVPGVVSVHNNLHVLTGLP